ncbi:hypothetical protein LTR40_014071, partial [Exophiala xenobiotica]
GRRHCRRLSCRTQSRLACHAIREGSECWLRQRISQEYGTRLYQNCREVPRRQADQICRKCGSFEPSGACQRATKVLRHLPWTGRREYQD